MFHDITTIRKSIGSWKEIAGQEIDDIGGWRRAPDKVPSWEPPNRLFGLTSYLCGQIIVNDPRLDPAPLRDVQTAVERWYRDHSDRDIPTQGQLAELLDRAVMMLDALLVKAEADAPWFPAEAIRKQYSIRKDTLSKWAKTHPDIRRVAMTADKQRWSDPRLKHVFHADRVLALHNASFK